MDVFILYLDVVVVGFAVAVLVVVVNGIIMIIIVNDHACRGAFMSIWHLYAACFISYILV